MENSPRALQSLVPHTRDLSFAEDELEADSAQAVSPGSVVRKIWFVVLVSCMFHCFMTCELHLFIPYLYTRVRCCHPGEPGLLDNYDVSEPALVEEMLRQASEAKIELQTISGPANTSVIPACAIPRFPTHSSLWSLSPSCVNKAYVEDTVQQIYAVVKMLQKVAGLVVLPVGGSIADGIGRRPVLGAYALCLVASALMYVLDSHIGIGNLAVYIGGVIICVLYQPQQSILSGSVADLVGHRERQKNIAFAAMSALNIVSELLCNVGLYFFLRLHLSHYALPWSSLAFFGIAMLFLLCFAVPESLPSKLRQPFSFSMLNPFSAQKLAILLVRRDVVLIRHVFTVFLFWIYFLGFQTIKVSYLISLGFSMEETLLPELIANVAQVAFSFFLVPLMPAMGAWNTCVLGHALFVTTYFLWGPFTVIVGKSGAYIAHVVQAAAFACIFPSWQTIVSQRVEGSNQSKCQSAVSALGTLGIIVGVPLYNRVLFTATAQGDMKAIPPTTSMVLAMLCCIISRHTARLASTTAPIFEAELQDFDQIEIRNAEE